MTEREDAARQDTVPGTFDRDDVRESDDSGLGGGIVGGQRLPEEARRRRDDDEPAIAPGLQRPERRLAHVEAAVEVDVEHASPVPQGQPLELHGLEYPGVAYHRIQPTEPIDGRTHDRLPAF